MLSDEEREIYREVAKERFFTDPSRELRYFQQRMREIESYKNENLKRSAYSSLINRYIRALSNLSYDDILVNNALIDVYKECLQDLGLNDYEIDTEIENYRGTYKQGSRNYVYVSQGSKQPKM